MKYVKRKQFKILMLVILSFSIIINLMSVYVYGKKYVDEYYFKRNKYNKIALTFDDGPHPVYTEKILEILEKYNVKATFFIIGQNAGYYKNTLKKISQKGHELGNHTFSHTVIKDKNALDIIAEVEGCRNAIYEICGVNTVLFRPPGGIMADINSADAELFENYDIIMWSIDTMDWAHHSVEQIANYVINSTKAGDIILMHDYIGKDSPTPRALEIIIPELMKKGYEFVTVSELISS